MAAKSERTGGVKTAATSPGAVRPRFRERQLLRADDLEAQQAYLIAARRRHNIGQHGWGIVHGLEIDTAELVVQPGVAVDGYGRELIVTSPVTIPSNVFAELGDVALDVWLVYQLDEMNVPQRGSWSCGPGRNTRIRERPTLRLTAAPKPPPRIPVDVPRTPVEVPFTDVPFLPHRTSPDDAAIEWPVYLGTIKEVPVADDPKSPRPFETLNGELVTAPSGLARMQVGAELQSDSRRFVVTLADTSGKLIERIGIDREGSTFITGNTTVTNPVINPDTRKQHLRLGPARLLNFRPLASTPVAAAPWQVYRTSVKEDKQTIQQLRFEIGHPGDKGDPTVSRFAVGTRDAAGVFAACFSISADCTLIIEGNVTVGGQLVEGPIQADASDPRFAALVAQNWVEGAKVGEVAATTGTILGVVTDTAGTPLRGVNVDLSNDDGVSTTTVVTDVEGRYVAPLIPTGDYTVSAQAPGFDRTIVGATLAASETLIVSITLRPITPSGIQGNVIDANGAPVPGASVEFRHTVSGAILTVTTTDSGFFGTGPIAAGRYTVRFTASGFVDQILDLAPNQTVTITLIGAAPDPDINA